MLQFSDVTPEMTQTWEGTYGICEKIICGGGGLLMA